MPGAPKLVSAPQRRVPYLGDRWRLSHALWTSRYSMGCPQSVDEMEDALRALAEKGVWVRPAAADSELIRVQLRRAARRRGIRVRTGYGIDDCLVAHTPDGLPAEEPWRGAAEHVHESGVLLRDAINRLPTFGASADEER